MAPVISDVHGIFFGLGFDGRVERYLREMVAMPGTFTLVPSSFFRGCLGSCHHASMMKGLSVPIKQEGSWICSNFLGSVWRRVQVKVLHLRNPESSALSLCIRRDPVLFPLNILKEPSKQAT